MIFKLVGQGGLSKKALNVQDDSRRKGIQGNTSKSEIKCVCLNARSIINKKTELNIMVDDIKPHIIGITESWANNDITNAELGLEGYVMFRKDRIGRRGGGVLLYIKDTIPAYEVQCYRTYNSYHWSSISLSQHNQTEQRKNSQCYK